MHVQIQYVVILFVLQFLTNTKSEQNETVVTDASPIESQFPPYLQHIFRLIRESENEFGYAEVREGAHLFWWLYFADGVKKDAHTKPLIIWIQGGPSIPASGFGNFLEIGPLTVVFKPNNNTWIKGRNVLFIDSPVGTGYSYVTSDDLYCKHDKDVAADLIELIRILLDKYPDFKNTTSHIFSQSYGTKIASYLGYYLHQEIKNGNISMNLKSVALGSSWVDPKASSLAYDDFLYQMGFIDRSEYRTMSQMTDLLGDMIDRKEYRAAWKHRLEILNMTNSFNIKNLFKKDIISDLVQLTSLMNTLIKMALGNSRVTARNWEIINENVIDSLMGELTMPSTNIVEKLLNETNLRVAVYNGNFDAATPMVGAVNWVHDLHWRGHDHFENATRKCIKGHGNGYYKEYEKLSLWWILEAGHNIPADNPEAMEQVLQYVINGSENKVDIGNSTEEMSQET